MMEWGKSQLVGLSAELQVVLQHNVSTFQINNIAVHNCSGCQCRMSHRTGRMYSTMLRRDTLAPPIFIAISYKSCQSLR